MTLPSDVLDLCQERFGLSCDEGIEVSRDQVLALARSLREELDFTFFVYCAAAHYPETEEEPDRTVVSYGVRRLPTQDRPTDLVEFRVMVPSGESMPSLSRVWAGADWEEREQFDLVGTLFADHPDLRRIMLSEDWPGHPLRRDYDIATPHFPWR